MSLQIGNFQSFPVIQTEKSQINKAVEDNISITKNDWNAYEISWDFNVHPLV